MAARELKKSNVIRPAQPSARPAQHLDKLTIIQTLVEPENQTLLLTWFPSSWQVRPQCNGLTLEPCLELSGQFANAAKCAINRACQSTNTILP